MNDQNEGPARPAAGRRRGRHARRRHPILRGAAWVAGLVVLGLVAATAVAVLRLNSNVNRVDVSKVVGTDRPTPSGTVSEEKALNLLLMGSDTRAELTTKSFGPDTVEGGSHSDTTILVHISAKRDRVLAVSIPRDSMLPGPKDCSPESPKNEWVIRQWNYNFNKGGAGCSIRALEGNTGVFIDHYAVVNFEGFAAMVDALGGVEICTRTPINDEASGLELAAGRHVLEGASALAYVRARKSIGDGSDLGRIERQQAFLASVVQKATDTSLLLRPDKLYGFLSAATKSLTTDPDFGAQNMSQVAQGLQKVGLSHIQFATVPTEQYLPDPNRVQWAPSADELWDAIRSDRALGAPATPSPSPSSSPDSTTTPSASATLVRPDAIAVRVLNASGTEGIATQTANALRVQGFNVVGLADAPLLAGVVIEHSSARADSAATLAAAFPGARLKLNETMGDTVSVSVGAGAPFVVAVPNRLGTEPIPTPSVTPTANPSAVPSIPTKSAADDICR